MRVSVVVAALAVVASALTLDKRQDAPPACATDCMTTSQSTTCPKDDIPCLCKDQEYSILVLSCFGEKCKEEEVMPAIMASCARCRVANSPVDGCP